MPAQPTTPATTVIEALRRDLMRWAPFAQMRPALVDRLLAASSQVYFASGETALSPADGPLSALWVLREGSITALDSEAEGDSATDLEAGELFPVAAAMTGSAATAHYQAHADTFCLVVPIAVVREIATESTAFSGFLNDRIAQLLTLSRQALQAASARQALGEQSLATPLARLSRSIPVAMPPETPIGQALALMHSRRIGSVLVTNAAQVPVGIVTRHDVLERITLPQVPLTDPIAQVMTTPVHSLPAHADAQEAALLMARHGIRHIPLTQAGRLVGLVSERDLFAQQQLSIRSTSAAIRRATDAAELPHAAQRIRALAALLLGQGIGARHLTELISHLNDVLTARLVTLTAEQMGLDLRRVCWLAFGSEGRSEQTIATDQDNGIVFESDQPERDRAKWLALGRAVNRGLDACGYPLCKGNVMAANPACCLSADEWVGRFSHWIEHGAPTDLLKASIHFDLRPLAGNLALARPLQDLLISPAVRVPRFIKQMADNALQNRGPLTWLGTIDTRDVDGLAQFDLKLQGTALFTDIARLYALAHGIGHTNTSARLASVGAALGADSRESQAWCTAFEFLQMLRLRTQIGGSSSASNPNLIVPAHLDDVDRRVLKTCLQALRSLRQRLALDYPA